MPTGSRRENIFIQRFLSAYEDCSWRHAKIDWIDMRLDNAVEAVATRHADGKTVAIEHTIIEPFLKEKEDFAFFNAAFLGIEQDPSLPVENMWIRLFVPVGALRHQRKQTARNAIVDAVHGWLKLNRLSLSPGRSEHICRVPAIKGMSDSTLALNIEVVPLKGPGALHVRRQQVESNLGDVIRKALAKKLPKLVSTAADKRLLLLERQHMNLFPEQMLAKIDECREEFPALAAVDEIWIIETMFYDRESYLRFECYQDGACIRSLNFHGNEFLY